jgi:hypothetical protein
MPTGTWTRSTEVFGSTEGEAGLISSRPGSNTGAVLTQNEATFKKVIRLGRELPERLPGREIYK